MNPPANYVDLPERLAQLRKLEPGWHDEEPSLPVSEDASKAGAFIVEQFRHRPLEAFLYPTVEGGLIFEWTTGELSCSLEVDPSGGGFFLAVRTLGGTVSYERDIEAGDQVSIVACIDFP